MRSKKDDRKSRNVVVGALLILILFYCFKFTYPQYTIQDTIIKHNSYNTAQEPISKPTNAGKSIGAAATAAAAAAPAPSFDGPSNGTIIDKVAVIIEDRHRPSLIPLILHFSSVLGPSWPIIIYTSSENFGAFSTSAALSRYLRSGLISIRLLPSTVLFTNSDSVSSFLTKPWLWEKLAPAKHILMFQSDSMLCANAARSVEDFFEYDFVGAPINPEHGVGMNGGLSLRKRETMLRIVEEWNWEEDKGSRFEDRWFFDRLKDLTAREEEEGGPPEGYAPIKIPSLEVARTFSVETIDFPHPLGVHQVHRWLSEHMVSMDEWCPEYKLCSEEYVKDE